MNDAVNRFGYTGGSELIRLPGPCAPLQDEPQDPESVKDRKNTKTVLIPLIQSMKDYILKHHKRMILGELNRAVSAGALPPPPWHGPEGAFLNSSNVSFEDMRFWRINRHTLLADVLVQPSCPEGFSFGGYYQEVYVDMSQGMRFHMGENGLLENLNDRDYWKLSRFLIPILTKEQIEEGAEELLLRYCPGALSDKNEHSPYLLAARMGLRVERLPLFRADKTLSMIFFCPGTVIVQDDPEDPENDPPPPYEVAVPGNTILINTRAVHKDHCQLEIYHECVHYDWHFMFYRLQDMHNNDVEKLKTRRVVVKDNTRNLNPLSWMEWQANRGSFGLMMPLTMMRPEVSKRLDALNSYTCHQGKKYDIIGRGIARDYDLPKFRVRARIIQMSRIAARGSLNYVDGRYIEPFAFDLENGSGDYTFVLTRDNMFEEYRSNKAFREMLDSGRYVFADGHLCVNDERYVRETQFGLRLTEWANAHVDECCLRFISVYIPSGISGYRFGCLNSDEEYNRHYISIAADNTGITDPLAFQKMNELLDGLPPSFPAALAYLMDYKQVTEEKLEEITGISVSTISRLRRKEKNNYSVDQVLAVCVGLNLPPMISREMFVRAGIILRSTKQHRAYQMILDCLYMDSLEEVQNFLARQGCDPLKLKAS